MQFYPHDTKGKNIRALYQSEKWCESLNQEHRVQMAPYNGKHYYIFEPITLMDHPDSHIVVPIFFYQYQDEIWGKCFCAKFSRPNQSGNMIFYIRANIGYNDQDLLDIPVRKFNKLYSEIRHQDGSLLMSKCDNLLYEHGTPIGADPIRIPNPWRERAGKKIIRHVPITLYSDDTSGNQSKRWNKHISYYFTLGGLPPEMTNMEYNCHFIATSNVASALEIGEPIVAEINHLATQGSIAFDAGLKHEVLYMVVPLAFLADSPMSAEITSTFNPGQANNPCRMCHLSTQSKEHRCSLEFLRAFFGLTALPVARKWHETKSRSHELWELYYTKSKNQFKLKTAEYGLKDQITHRLMELHTQKVHERVRIAQLAEHSHPRIFNSYLELASFDGCNHTPVEILHVVLLGCVKYLMADLMTNRIPKSKLKEVEARLRSFNTDALNFPQLQATYMMAHHRSFIGKDFQIILQVAAFVLFPYMTEDMKNVWYSMCFMSSMVFQTVIPDMETYIQQLEGVIREFMYHISKMSGRWSNKPKIHMLLHLPQSIRRFGPPILFATEKFENYNGIVRTASIHSNRQAPSHDLALTFSNYHIERLLYSGAYLHDSKTGEYFQAKPNVTNIFKSNVLIQKLFGYNSTLVNPMKSYPCLHSNKPNIPEAELEPIPEALTARPTQTAVLDKYLLSI
ncbi:hypothetical protein PTTG_30248 [Puccinia triticina 1-1 BBBD Race 1]|uniref:Uncharacterized protein n=1 Tax=Puccinia triticina (isolate 1-1 / race 1 (BBBD)) TaxID=630390 RepID=A0A180FZL6_PUCT1|nr:hypothetical protein PTTG_30248 [Puccinia triticina 1-1 BBBD Race 1]